MAMHFLNLIRSFHHIIQKGNIVSAHDSVFNREALSQDELELVKLAGLLDKQKVLELLRNAHKKGVSVEKLLSVISGETYESKGDLHEESLKFMPLMPKKEEVKAVKRKHFQDGEITPQKDFAIPILEALVEMGGRGKAKYVLRRINEKMRDKFKPMDLERLPHSPEKRWMKSVRWEKQRLVNEGYLRKDSPQGIWEITEKGRKYYKKLKGESQPKRWFIFSRAG